MRGSCVRLLQRGVEVEVLDALALLALLQRPEQLVELVLLEAGEREVDAVDGLEVGEQAGEQLVVPGAADLVQGEVQQAGLLEREVDEHDGHGLAARAGARRAAAGGRR